MPVSNPTRTPFYPSSQTDLKLVRDELEEVLKSMHFRSSKRYPAFLEYVVDQRLKGNGETLKERTLGIEVFKRPVDYDTNNDTVVRVAAGEVRKRLALVYHERGATANLQISLPSGSYVPEFFRIQQPLPEEASAVSFAVRDVISAGSETTPALVTGDASADESPIKRSKSRWLLLAILLCIGLLALGWFAFRKPSQITVDQNLFWKPLLDTRASVLIIPGTIIQSDTIPEKMHPAEQKDLYPYTSFATTVALSNLTSALSDAKKAYEIRSAPDAGMSDMREHAVVIIGAYNNQWLSELQKELPLQFAFGEGSSGKIYDVKDSTLKWSRPPGIPRSYRQDYAVIARFRSSETGNWILLVAGIGPNGTEAASQYVTMPHFVEDLLRTSPGWSTKNVELLLNLSVIDGKSGTPTLAATRVW